MIKSEFAEILTSLYNGNRGEAEQTAEDMSYSGTNYEDDPTEKINQERMKIMLAIQKSKCYNKNIKKYY